jgi:hypothetical protein
MSTSSIATPFRRGLEDEYRYVSMRAHYKGTWIVSREVPGAPNVLCIEEVVSNLREPDRMSNSGGLGR